METKEQKIDRLKKERAELRNSKVKIMKSYNYKIRQVDQELKELEDGENENIFGRTNRNRRS